MDLGKADRQLRTLKAKGETYTTALGEGISARVTASGTRNLELRARLHGTVLRLPIGTYPATTMAEAYEKATRFKALLKQGMHPLIEERRRQTDNAPKTVVEAAQRFIVEHLEVKTRERWATEARRLIATEILPELGPYPLVQLQRTDLTGLVDRKAASMRKKGKRGVAANRLAAVLGKLFTWCADKGWLPTDIARRLPKPAKEEARDRALTSVEAGQLWNLLILSSNGSGPIPAVHARVLQLLTLTGARCSEITSLSVDSVDEKVGTLTIANGKTAASSRALPLTPAARAVIEAQLAQPRAEGQGALFPSPRAGTVIPSNEISRSARDLLVSLKHQRWTPHDLRRTVASVMADADVDGDVRRRVTGHQAGDVHGRVYDRALRLDAVRSALLTVERWVLDAATKTAAGETSDNVVSMPRRG